MIDHHSSMYDAYDTQVLCPYSQDPNAAIAVFDSGLGGLDIASAISRILPQEHLIYLGDTARVPYGTRSSQTVRTYTFEAARFLIQHKHVKALVIACNTASASAQSDIKQAQQQGALVFGMIQAGVKACQQLTTGHLLVLATAGTVRSQVYQKALQTLPQNHEILTLACPLFVPLVEAGWSDKKVSLDIILEQLQDLIPRISSQKKISSQAAWEECKKIKSVLLGCTHYPLLKVHLKTAIEEWLGHQVAIVDGADQVALQLKEALHHKGLLNTSAISQRSFFTTDQPEYASAIAERFWQARTGEPLPPLMWTQISSASCNHLHSDDTSTQHTSRSTIN